jgi:hypothetical protein
MRTYFETFLRILLLPATHRLERSRDPQLGSTFGGAIQTVDEIDLEAERCSRGETMNIGLKIAGPDENIFRDSDCDFNPIFIVSPREQRSASRSI